MKTTKTIRASRRLADSAKRPIRASRRAIKADEEIEEIEEIEAPVDDVEDVAEFEEDAPVTEEILFEASDVAKIIAEVTGEDVDYTEDSEATEVTFTIGEDEITVTPEGDEEVVEESTRVRGRKIAAAKQMRARRVAASRRIRR